MSTSLIFDIKKYAINNPKLFVDYGNHLACPRNPKIFEQPHLLICETGINIVATIDIDQFYIMSSLYCGILINQQYSLEYILALMNSSLFNFLMFKINLENTGGAFTKAKIYHYKQLPIKSISIDKQKSFIDLVDKILKITKFSDYSENLNKQTKVQKYGKQIDQMVYKLYNLTPEEIKIVEN